MKYNTLILAAVLGIILLSSVAVRLYNLNENPLWLDEAWIACSLLEPDLQSMIWYDRMQQTMPIPILIILRFINSINNSEFALRLLSAISGSIAVLIVPLFLYLAGEDLVAITISALLIGFSPAAISLSRQMRQYSIDSLFVVLPFLTLYYWYIRREKWRAYLAGATVLISSTFSYLGIPASIIAMLMLCVAELIRKPKSENSSRFPFIILASVLVLFIGNYNIILKYHNLTELPEIWSRKLNAFPTNATDILWYASSTFDIFSYNWPQLSGTIAMFFTAGLIILCQKAKFWLLFPSILMIGGLIGASLFGFFPYCGNRITHGLIGLLVIPISISFSQLGRFLASKSRSDSMLWGLLFVSLLIAPLSKSTKNSQVLFQDIRSAAAMMTHAVKPGDVIWVYHNSVYALEYYGSEQIKNMYFDNPNIKGSREFLAKLLYYALKSAESDYLYDRTERNIADRSINNQETALRKPVLWTVFSHEIWNYYYRQLLPEMDGLLKIKAYMEYEGALVVCWELE